MLRAVVLTPRLSECFQGSWSFQFTLFTCKLSEWHPGPADLCLEPSVTIFWMGALPWQHRYQPDRLPSWQQSYSYTVDDKGTVDTWVQKFPKRDLEARNSYCVGFSPEAPQVSRWWNQHTNLEQLKNKKKAAFCNTLYLKWIIHQHYRHIIVSKK